MFNVYLLEMDKAISLVIIAGLRPLLDCIRDKAINKQNNDPVVSLQSRYI